MIIGITGTRNGATAEQIAWARSYFEKLSKQKELHYLVHGCALGADEQIATEAYSYGFRVGGHPSNNDYWTSDKAKSLCYVLAKPLPPLKRNLNIIHACEVLLAFPASDHEELRSGTWMTIRSAGKEQKRTIICWPDGKFVEYRNGFRIT